MNQRVKDWPIEQQAAAVVEALVRGNYSLLPWSNCEYLKGSNIPESHRFMIQGSDCGQWLDSIYTAADLENIMTKEADIMRNGWRGKGRDSGSTRIVKIKGRWRV